jgi:hypothetical protein
MLGVLYFLLGRPLDITSILGNLELARGTDGETEEAFVWRLGIMFDDVLFSIKLRELSCLNVLKYGNKPVKSCAAYWTRILGNGF